jgi:hypothetical protein
MQYFKKELWRALNSKDLKAARSSTRTWDRNLRSYRTQLEALETRLSKSAFRFFSRVSLHDGRLLEWTLGEAINLEIANAAQFKRRDKPPTARIRVITYQRDVIYELHYLRVREAQFAFPSSEPLFRAPGQGIDDWGYDELTAVDRQYLKHEALFASGATMSIVFETFNYHRHRARAATRT